MARAGNYIKVTSSPSATRRSERKALFEGPLFEGPLFGGAAAGTYMLRMLSIALGVTAFVAQGNPAIAQGSGVEFVTVGGGRA
jgi:hypothetical protein